MLGFGVPRKELINGILLTKHLKYNSKMTVRTATISTSTDLIKVIKYLRLGNTTLTSNHCCAPSTEEFLTYSDRLLLCATSSLKLIKTLTVERRPTSICLPLQTSKHPLWHNYIAKYWNKKEKKRKEIQKVFMQKESFHGDLEKRCMNTGRLELFSHL